jgi:hypothetical protein
VSTAIVLVSLALTAPILLATAALALGHVIVRLR